MSLRRILAELADPDVRAEIRELRDIAARSEIARGHAVAEVLAMRADQAAVVAVTEAIWKARCDKQCDELRADVTRLLEDAQRCAHEHHEA